ncbi:MAG: hypothetical protein ABJE95_27670 [Byssovorax sp.]
MDNLAHVMAVTVANNQIIPCIKVMFGAFRAATQQDASFNVNLSFTYVSGGQHVGPILATQSVARLQFVQPIDAYFARARGLAVDLPSMPDSGTPVVCIATLQYPNREGTPLDCGPADTSTFYPTFGR